MSNDKQNPNYVQGYGDLSQPEAMLYYKIDLAIKYRDQQLDNPDCSAGELYEVIQNITFLRHQLTQLHDAGIALVAPTQDQIDGIKALAAQVEALGKTDAEFAAGLALLNQVAGATKQLMPAV